MAAPVIVPFVPRAANPGTATVSDSPSSAATGPAANIYFPPATAQAINAMFKVLSSCVATVEVSCSPISQLIADTGNGIWKAASAALTGVTGGAIVLATLPPGVVAVRINYGTALAGNQATLEMSTTNPMF